YVTHEPPTGQTDREYDQTSAVVGVLDTVTRGYRTWSGTDVSERDRILIAIADAFDAEAEELAKAITTEMGKLPDQAVGEVKLAASIYRWYGENGPGVVEPELLDVPGARVHRVRTEPTGPLLGGLPG